MNKALTILFLLFHAFTFAQKNDSTSIKNQQKIEELKKRVAHLEGSTFSDVKCKEENQQLRMALKQYQDSVAKLHAYYNSKPASEPAKSNSIPVYANFELGSTSANYDGNRQLDSIISIFKTTGNYKLKLAGHTDRTGSEDINLALSKKRAESLKKYLVSKKNIPADRIITEWYGSSMPAVTDAGLKNSAKCRRVEVSLVQ